MQPEETKKIIEEFLRMMGIQFDEVSVAESAVANCPKFSIKSNDSRLLIGSRGAHLLALNHLIKKMVGKGKAQEEPLRFFVDVNNYQEEMLEQLRATAKIMGERARSFKVDVTLDPMSSYERMIIHSYFQDASDLKTESRGEGENRRVVIKYIAE